MSTVVSVQEAKKQLSKLLDEVSEGAEITITSAGKPVAKLVPVPQRKPGKTRKPGALRGKIQISPDFFEPLPEEELREWEK
jgi:prevent-host-death family protein